MIKGAAVSAEPRIQSRELLLYTHKRFPLPLVVALLLTYICIYEMLAVAGRSNHVSWPTFAGGLGFVCAFLGLRLIDDIDDWQTDRLDRDPAATPAGRQSLTVLLGVILVGIVLMDLRTVVILATLLAAIGLAAFTAFVVKVRVTRSAPVLALFYEASPLLCFVAPYEAWWYANHKALPAWQVTGAVLYFWILYQIWKFSRKIGEDVFQPYGLSPNGLRRAVLTFLALFLVIHTILMIALSWSVVFFAFGCLAPACVAIWVSVGWPAPATWGHGSPLQLAGLALVSAMDVALLTEVAIRPP